MQHASSSEEAGRPPALLTRRELAKLCKVSTRTVDNWVAQRKVPVIRHSKRCVRFSWPDVISAFRSREEGLPG